MNCFLLPISFLSLALSYWTGINSAYTKVKLEIKSVGRHHTKKPLTQKTASAADIG